jgi:hypothetical protein
MIGKTSLLIVVVFIASCTLAQDCSLTQNFIGQLSVRINNNQNNRIQLAKRLNVPSLPTSVNNIQTILYNYYRLKGFIQIDDIAFNQCAPQFDTLIYNSLVSSQIIPNNWMYMPPIFPCTDSRNITYSWVEPILMASNGRSVNLAPVFSYLTSIIREAINSPAIGLTYASAFNNNCPSMNSNYVSIVKSFLSVSFCTPNDVLFDWILAGLNNMTNVQALAPSLNIYANSYENMTRNNESRLIFEDPIEAQDFMTYCSGQLDRIIFDTIRSSGIVLPLPYSALIINASSAAALRDCTTPSNTFVYNTNTRVLSCSSGSFNFSQIMQSVRTVMNSPIPSVGTLGSLLNARVQFCAANKLPGKPSLVDALFLAIRRAITGRN